MYPQQTSVAEGNWNGLNGTIGFSSVCLLATLFRASLGNEFGAVSAKRG